MVIFLKRKLLVNHVSSVFLFCVIGLIANFISIPSVAQGDLLIMPKRVVFEGIKRSEELNLANTGKDTATYSISFIQIRMKVDGSFENITQPDSGQYFAEKYLRFFPRTVTLAPNEAQAVKVQITRSNELVQGEYRSHLYFRSIPNNKPLGEKEPANDSGISVKLIPVFGISIPVIIRVGDNTSAVSLSDISFQLKTGEKPAVTMMINRTGNMSVYGDLMVDHISSQGKVSRVGMVKGLAVYAPNSVRRFHLELENMEGSYYHTGKLRIRYLDQSARTIQLAEEEIVLH
ncbi:MAG: hypothetical protein JWM28_1005 [Chitinophagaceae bacterium]|nr:hypothetical protein [Chitinophagaceae bacterium]